MEKWQQLEQWICEQLKELDPYIKRTPGSGNKSIKGDIKFSTNLGLNIEAKNRCFKSVFKQEWLDKVNEEIPLHVDKIGIVITENKDGKKVTHLNAEDFLKLYKELINYRKGKFNAI